MDQDDHMALVIVSYDAPGRAPGVAKIAMLMCRDVPFPLAMACLSDYSDAQLPLDPVVVVDYIQTPDHLRRRGYASELVDRLRDVYPHLRLTDAISPEGQALLDALTEDGSSPDLISPDHHPHRPAARRAKQRSVVMYAYERLAVITLAGYRPVTEGGPGTLDWLVATYHDQTSDESRHVLAVDLDCPGDEIALLVDQTAVASLRELAEAHGYSHRDTRSEESVGYFGDGVDQVAICRHPDGWIVLPA